MDTVPSERSFKYLVLPLLILIFVTGGADPLTRARDRAATVQGPSETTSLGRLMCDTAVIAACRMAIQTQRAGNFKASVQASEPLIAQVQTDSGGPLSLLQIRLQLQRDLFTRGGRLAPIDALVDAAAAAPTERPSKVLAWATRLRVLETGKREVRGR
jgi:hypothetical protein